MLSGQAKRWSLIVAVLFFHLSLGAWYAGHNFIDNLTTAVARNAAGGEGGPQTMVPGDQFEQLYRYSLPRYNLERGRSPYYGGYQYNLSSTSPPFSEGWVYFPFSLIDAGFSWAIGDIPAYNLIALLSFPAVGGAMYLLVFFLTRSHSAALVSSILLALLPHRTSFLFGEMIYGVDLMWPPLILLTFEKSIRTFKTRYALLFGLCVLLYSTSNIQGFYFFALFSSVYFALRGVQVLRESVPPSQRTLQILAMFVSVIPTAAYLYYWWSILSHSGLESGQDYAETTFYSPTLINLVTVWSGNEKTIYLGWALVLAIGLVITFGFKGFLSLARRNLSNSDRSVFVLACIVFVASYVFCFGPHLDSMFGVDLYKWYFQHVPGASGTRTPGRLMGTAGFYFALAFGFLFALTESKVMSSGAYRFAWWPFTATVALIIVINFHYVSPVMVTIKSRNAAYKSIENAPGIVYTVPIRREAPHFLNAVYQYYALEYNLKIFGGHSSVYPRQWDNIIGNFLPINHGLFDRQMMERFKARGITHLVVNATTYEPRVSPLVLTRLLESPFLHRIAEDDGVNVFSVDYEAKGDQQFDLAKLAEAARRRPEDVGHFIFLDGWYDREVYSNQQPFRWMRGTSSNGLLVVDSKQLTSADLSYWCPLEELQITINGRKAEAPSPLSGGWKELKVDLSKYGKDTYFFRFTTPRIFRAPPDTRKFGCQLRDVEVN